VGYRALSRFDILIFCFGRVKSLSNVLRDIDDILPQRDFTGQQKTELCEIAQGCRDVLKQLENTLDKYQELDHSTKGLGGRSRRVWKRFKWDQKEIDRLRSRITLNVTLFDAFLGRITRYSPACSVKHTKKVNSISAAYFQQQEKAWTA
jgi:hypothetical protein